jgi:outer membrane protein assembly factor BamB
MNKPITVLALTIALTLAGRAADWPQWRGPNQDGISTETGWTTQWPAGGPKQLWKANVGTGFSSVTVSQGRVFTLGNKADTDTVYCFAAETGNLLWKYSYACPLNAKYYEGGPGATPTVDSDRVYTVSKTGQLFCFNAADGKIIWSKNLQTDLGGKMPTWGYAGSVLVFGNWAILDVGAPGGATIALDKLTGNVVWKNGQDPVGYGTLLLFRQGDRALLASFNGFGLVVREATTGKEVARFPWKTSYEVNAATPIVAGDKLFISSGYGKGCALVQLTPTGLQEVYTNKKMRNHFNNCVLWKGYLYGFDESTLTCLTLATGDVQWKQEGLGKGSLMIADGKLIIQAEKGDLVIATPTPAVYKEIARAKVQKGLCWTTPVLANGRIYTRNAAGGLVCVDVKQ